MDPGQDNATWLRELLQGVVKCRTRKESFATVAEPWSMSESLTQRTYTIIHIYTHPLVMTNIAMENGPFIDGLPIKHGDFQ